MIDFIFDFFLNTVCYKIGVFTIETLSFRGIKIPRENDKYIWIITLVGLLTTISVGYGIIIGVNHAYTK